MKNSCNIEPILEPLFTKVRDRLFLCKSRKMPSFTDFYDPAKWSAFSAAINDKDIHVVNFGGFDDCERRMIGFFPFDEDCSTDDFPIKCLQISHNVKFNKSPRHQDYLGSIIGLGFDRGRIGDILIGEEYAQVFVHLDISDYICQQLEHIGRVPVKLEYVDKPKLSQADEIEAQLNVASFRLDALVAAVFKISRGQTLPLIRSEKVFVNWMPCIDPSKKIKPGDMITLRGHGRARIGEVLGTTKKDRLRVSVFRSK